MPVISAVIAKHEFVEIGIDMLAAQAVICPEAPSAQQRKSSMNPRQHNVRGHLADDARIMPVACQTRIGFVAVGEQRGSTLHVGVYEGFDRGGGIAEGAGPASSGARPSNLRASPIRLLMTTPFIGARRAAPIWRSTRGIVRDHGEANAAGTRVEIFGVLASRFGYRHADR